MASLMSQKQTQDILELYAKEFYTLSKEHDDLQLENADTKLRYKKKLKAEREEKRALSQEIDNLKKKLQEVNSVNANTGMSVKVISPSAMKTPGQNLEDKHSAEYHILAAELEMEKKKSKALSEKIAELNHQLQTEKDLRVLAEAKTDQAVQFASDLMLEFEELHKTSQKSSVEGQMLDAELKSTVEGSNQEIQHLNDIIHKEKELRAKEEANKLEAVKVADALHKEAEELQKALNIAKKLSDDTLEKLSAVEKNLEKMSNSYMTVKNEKDCLEQEIVELLQKQNDIQDQTETTRLRDFEILEAICQESQDQVAERETLSTRLEMAEKTQKDLKQDILWLTEMLKKETELRVQAQKEKLEAINIGEALCQKMMTCEVCSRS